MKRSVSRLTSIGILSLAAACVAQKPPPGPTPEEALRANMEKLAETDRSVNAECFGKLQRHEIATNRSYVECYVAKVRPAYQQYGPENLDLLDSLAKQWRAIADQLDAGKIKSADAQAEMARVKTEIESEAQRRAAEAEALAAAGAATGSSVEGDSPDAVQNRRMLLDSMHDKTKPSTTSAPGSRGGN
jgi:hypothetical protein